LTFWKNKNVYAKVTRNCRWPETVEFTVHVCRHVIYRSKAESPRSAVGCKLFQYKNVFLQKSPTHYLVAGNSGPKTPLTNRSVLSLFCCNVSFLCDWIFWKSHELSLYIYLILFMFDWILNAWKRKWYRSLNEMIY